MQNSLIFIKKYWLVILGTLVVGLFTALPSLVFFQRIGDNWRGVYPVFNGDALFYQARIREIYDGHGAINHAYFFEHKNDVYPQQVGAEYFAYGLTKILGISAPAAQLGWDFAAPALIFLLTYLFFKKFTANEYTAVFFPASLYTAVMGGLFKPIHPQVTLPLLLLFLFFWSKLILSAQKKWRNSLAAGLILGLLFLTYFYHWSFLLVVIGIYLLIVLFEKAFGEIKYHALMLGVAVVIGLPYFLKAWASLEAPGQAETMARLGLYFSHLPESYPRLAVALVWLAFFAWFARHYKIEKEKPAQIITALLGANVLYPNHQIITGMILNNAAHWSWMPILIFSASAHYMVGILRRENMKLWKNRLMLLAVAMLLILPAWRLSTFFWHSYPEQYKNNIADDQQYYAGVFSWINANTKPDDVILSDMQLMSFIPVYTAANVYNSYYAFVLPASDQEIIERALLAHFFEPDFFTAKEFGYKGGDRILWSLTADAEANTHSVAGIWAIPYEPRYSLEAEKQAIRKIYDNLLKNDWDMSLLKKYRLDYIIWDKAEHPEWNVAKDNELELAKQIGDILIYRVKS